jgi:hypothetical protein
MGADGVHDRFSPSRGALNSAQAFQSIKPRYDSNDAHSVGIVLKRDSSSEAQGKEAH